MDYTNVQNIVYNCFSDLNAVTDENYKRYFKWVHRGYKQLRLFKLPLNVAKTLPVQTNIRCVILPKDYVSFVAIGKTDHNHFQKFSLKDDLLPNTTESCGTETQTYTNPTYEKTDYYSIGGGISRWYYRLDEGNNRILIDGDTLTEATLVYKSTGIDFNGETYIPMIAEEALIAWVHYQEALADKDKGMIAIRKAVFDGAVNDIQLLNWNNDAMIDAIYSTIYQGVKR
jgi:hypothetical protein